MDRRALVVAAGVGFGTGLVVAVAVIALLPVEFSALVGLPVGLLVGVAVLTWVTLEWEQLRPAGRQGAIGGAAFGYVILAGLAARYVDLAGLRSSLGVRPLAALAVVAAVAAGMVARFATR